jgi:MFS family permease
MGIYMMVLMGGTPVGSPVLGWIADVLGIRLAMVIFGLITALGSATVFLVLSRGTDYRRRKPE